MENGSNREPFRDEEGHTLTNFLSIFALMSLARVKNACEVSTLLVPQQQEAGASWFLGATMEWGWWDSEVGVSPVQPHLLPRPAKTSTSPGPMTLSGEWASTGQGENGLKRTKSLVPRHLEVN